MGLETWIAVATCVQAAPAVAIVILTWRLARSIEQYAGAADRQLTELQAAREAAILPYVHVGGIGYSNPALLQRAGLSFNAELVNVGTGPATRSYKAVVPR